MKEKPRVLNLLLVFVFLFGSLGVTPQPVEANSGAIQVGDVAIILMNTDTPDAIAFLTLADLPEGESIIFTDSGWYASGGFRATEGAIRYTVPTGGISAGTIIYRDDPFTENNWDVPSGLGFSGSIALSASGDQVIVFQGDTTTYSLIYGINNEGSAVWQADATSSNTSALPTGLIDGDTAVAVSETDNIRLNCGENHTGTKVELLAYISNSANWVGDNDVLQSIDPNCSFTVTSTEMTEPKINEFSASTTGDDVEYVEIYGETDTDFSAYTVLEIEGDSTAPGVIDHVIALGTSDTNGLYLASLTNGDLENGTLSLLLVKDFTGTLSDDLDTNDDGVLDVEPWTELTDSVAVNDGDTGDMTYGIPVLGPNYDGVSTFAPGGASRIPDGNDTDSQSDWMRNEFDLNNSPITGEAYNTPGLPNSTDSAAPEMPPYVTKILPLDTAVNVPLDTNIELVFSELVILSEGWYEINCDVSGIHEATDDDTSNPIIMLDPLTDFVESETCVITIIPEYVQDADTDDEVYNYMEEQVSFSFTTLQYCGAEYTPIYEIQGSDLDAAITGPVSTEGVVVGDFQEGGKDGYFIQDMNGGDGDTSTSDGIFIYAPSSIDVNVGDHVRVAGSASDYYDMTQISASQVWLCDTGVSLEPTEFALPAASELDFERYEGMLVTIPQDLVISEYFNFDRYGEIMLTTERFMTFTALNEPDVDGYAASQEEYFLNSITLDDGLTVQNPDPAVHPNGEVFTLDNRFRGGDLVANVTGILDYYYDLYRIQPTQGADYTPTNPRPETYDLEEGDLKVASFNVLNYFTTIDQGQDNCGPSGDMECRGADTAEELSRQRDKILAAMSEIDADVFGLMEIENDRPGEASTDYAVADLVAGLNDIAGAGTFDYIPTGPIGSDAIKVAMIYKPAKVTPLNDPKILTSAIDPRFIDTKNRPTLAHLFGENETGEAFIVAVNHLKSKSGPYSGDPDPTDPSDFDQFDGAGWWNATRTSAAEAMMDWLENDAYFPDVANILIIGDLNSYDKEDPIDAIKLGADDLPDTDDDYLDMIYEIQGDHDYGYVFDGRVGYLDYAMVHNSLVDNVVDTILWKINADEPDLIDYDMSYKQDAQDDLYAPDAYRSSDHDPVIITLSLNDAPVAVADNYATDEDVPLVVDDSTGVLENDSDPEYQDLTAVLVTPAVYGTLVLNPNGSFTYTPNADFNGTDTFEYKASDGELESDPVTVTITVDPVNDAPVAAADAYETDEDVPLVVEAPGVLTNDTDVDGDTLTAVLVTDVTNGTLVLNADGSFTYTPNADFNGTDTFEYKASEHKAGDDMLESETVTVTITVNPVDDTFEIFLPIITK